MISFGRWDSEGPTDRPRRAASPARRRETLSFVAAVENPDIVQELRRMLDGLLGPSLLELLPEDGPIVLSRLQGTRPTLAFVSASTRRMEGLTILRALTRVQARRIVLLTSDTLEGYRGAWEALMLGARDFLATRGSPPHRLRGNMTQRVRQLAHLLNELHENGDGASDASTAQIGPGPAGESGCPWVAAPETRKLAAVTAWLGDLDPAAAAVIRIPEGPRFLRVAREGIGRVVRRPVRVLASGDRLVPGHIHLFSETEVARVDAPAGWPSVALAASGQIPGSFGAHREFYEELRASSAPLRILLPDGPAPDLETFLTGDDGIHTVFHLESGCGTSGARQVREPLIAKRRLIA